MKRTFGHQAAAQAKLDLSTRGHFLSIVYSGYQVKFPPLFKMPYRKGHKCGRAHSYFRKGHSTSPPTLPLGGISVNSVKTCKKNFNRLSAEIYRLGSREKQVTPCILRPRKATASVLEAAEEKAHGDDSSYCLVNLAQLSKFTSLCAREHSKYAPHCEADFTFPSSGRAYQGLGTSLTAVCRKCKFATQQQTLYNTVRLTGKGRPNVDLNVGLSQFMLSSGVAYKDVTLLFSLLNCKSISERGLKKGVKKVCAFVEKAGEQQLHKNREMLKEFVEHQEHGEVIVGTDSAYNNASKGRSFAARGTQVSTPVVEYMTDKMLPIHIGAATQICCTKPAGQVVCKGKHSGCTATMNPDVAICNAEGKAAEDAYKALERQTGKKITKFVADGTHLVMSKVKKNDANVEKLECITHVSRAQRRHFYKFNYSDELLGTVNKAHSKQVLSTLVVNRCAAEMTLARKRFKNDKKFFDSVEKARVNIVQCLSGVHTNCRQNSLVCDGKRPPALLHGQRFLNMSPLDRRNIQSAVDYRLNPVMVAKQRFMLSTNKIEALHNRVFRLCPKHKTAKRTFQARNLNAVLIDSIGLANATVEVAEKMGLKFSSAALCMLKKIQRDLDYHQRNQKTWKFIRSRHQLRLARLKLKQLRKLKVEDANNVPLEHSYALA